MCRTKQYRMAKLEDPGREFAELEQKNSELVAALLLLKQQFPGSSAGLSRAANTLARPAN